MLSQLHHLYLHTDDDDDDDDDDWTVEGGSRPLIKQKNTSQVLSGQTVTELSLRISQCELTS